VKDEELVSRCKIKQNLGECQIVTLKSHIIIKPVTRKNDFCTEINVYTAILYHFERRKQHSYERTQGVG